MKKLHLTLLALGAIALSNSATADWTDYFWIGSPNLSGVVVGQIAPSTVILPLNATPGVPPGSTSPWTFGSQGAPGSLTEFTRSPGAIGDAATGFTLTTRRGGLAQLTIENPDAAPELPADSRSYYCSKSMGYWYDFSWNFDAKAGSTAWWVDANGTNVIAPIIGTGKFWVNMAASPTSRDTYGFYMDVPGSLANTLQIQGWECVPEPSSIALSSIIGLGVCGAIVRKYRARKS